MLREKFLIVKLFRNILNRVFFYSAIPVPPDAEPVAPAKMLTAIASDINGFPLIPNNSSVNLSKPGTTAYN